MCVNTFEEINFKFLFGVLSLLVSVLYESLVHWIYSFIKNMCLSSDNQNRKSYALRLDHSSAAAMKYTHPYKRNLKKPLINSVNWWEAFGFRMFIGACYQQNDHDLMKVSLSLDMSKLRVFLISCLPYFH